VAREGRTLQLAQVMAEPNFRRGPFLEAEGFQAYLGQPLYARGEFVGVLEIFQRGPLRPTPLWRELLEVLTQQAGVAVADAHLVERLRRSNAELQQANDATLESLARALELRDQETAGHSDRVVNLTLALAQKLGVPAQNWEHLRRGALLHDFGKMGIPDAIFHKPGPLDAAEWEIMRRHPTYAYNWLVNIPFLRPALDIPYYHHEKWDGSGYPLGLSGTDIPLAARLFAIVDVWDALTSDRPYRAAWSPARTREYLQAQAGRHFDPEVVPAFLALVDA
jgi:HD-GYP domain-containing protein (c-di-GMP phosphodiesterase class II)